MTAEGALETGSSREILIDRRIVSLTPDRIEIHPARSIIFLPLLTLAAGIAIFPLIYFWGDSLALWLRLLITFFAILVVPLSGIGLVYSIAGAHIVVDRNKQTAVLQQGYLGMGVGTQELMPFYKIDYIQVKELTPHDWRGHQDDFAQYEIGIVKLSERIITVGLVTVARAEAAEGLSRARDVAESIAAMAGVKTRVFRPRSARAAD